MQTLIRKFFEQGINLEGEAGARYLELATKLADAVQDQYFAIKARTAMMLWHADLFPEKALIAYAELETQPWLRFSIGNSRYPATLNRALRAMLRIPTISAADIFAFQEKMIAEEQRNGEGAYQTFRSFIYIGHALGMPHLSAWGHECLLRYFPHDDTARNICVSCVSRTHFKTHLISKPLESNFQPVEQALNRKYPWCNPRQFLKRNLLYWLSISEPTTDRTARMERLFPEIDPGRFQKGSPGEFLGFWSATLLDRRRWPEPPIAESTALPVLEKLLADTATTRNVLLRLEAGLAMTSVLLAFGRLGRTSIPLTLPAASPYPRFGHEVPVAQAYDTALAQTRAIAGRLDARSGNQFHSNHVERVLGSLKAIPVTP